MPTPPAAGEEPAASQLVGHVSSGSFVRGLNQPGGVVPRGKRRRAMQPRMKNPVFVLPEAMRALHALGKATCNGLPETTLELVRLRASQINGCGMCVDMHARDLKRLGESDERLFAVAAWRDTPFFTDAERAALALTEAATRICDRPDAVSDEIWNDVARHYDERELSVLILNIAQINLWNRLNVTIKQVALGRAWTADDAKAAG
jgi:AhpD family alkylhydroperoxidase